MSNLETSFVINLAGNLARKSRQFGRAMQGMSGTGVRSFNRLSQSASRSLNSLGNRYTAFITGAAGAGAVRMVARLEQRFTRLGIQSRKSEEEMNRLKDTIFATASSPDIRLDPSQITSAIESIVEKTGDLDFARDNIRNIGLAIQATGADGGAIGDILAEFQKMGITAPAEVLKALDTLNEQGKEGAFTLQNLAALGPRVVTAYSAMGRTGTGSLRELGAALQVIRMGTGSSEQAATAFEAVLRTLSDGDKIKKLKELGGIEVFNDAGEFRAINELMADIIRASSGDLVNLSQVFDAEAVRAFNAAAAEFKRTGTLETLDKFMQLQGDGTGIMQDSARAAGGLSAAYDGLIAGMTKFADDNLTAPLQAVVDGLDFVNSKQGRDAIGGTIATIIDGGLVGNLKNSLGFFAGINEKIGQSIIDSARSLFGGDQKSSVDINIKSEVPVSVNNLKSSSTNHELNVDTGAVMVGQ